MKYAVTTSMKKLVYSSVQLHLFLMQTLSAVSVNRLLIDAYLYIQWPYTYPKDRQNLSQCDMMWYSALPVYLCHTLNFLSYDMASLHDDHECDYISMCAMYTHSYGYYSSINTIARHHNF